MIPLRIAAIGAGGMATGHFRNLCDFEDTELVAICDISEQRAVSQCHQYSGRPYTDYQKMLDSEQIDAVYICTPPFAHGQQELAVCQRQIPLFIEKPIATRMAVAEQINQAIQENSVISSVGYHWRYQKNTNRAKSLLSGQQVIGVLGYWMNGLPGTPWWRVREQSGGQHLEQTTHVFDLCRYLIDSDVVAVHGFATQGSMETVENYDLDDMSVVNIRFANGVVANVTSACMLKGWERVKLELLCNGLVVEIHPSLELGFIDTASGDRGVKGGTMCINRQGEVEEYDNDVSGYVEEDRIFIDAVKSGDTSQIRSPYADSLKTLELTLAASRSFETGQSIILNKCKYP